MTIENHLVYHGNKVQKNVRTSGRANKFLHWHDWLLLKNIGVIEYDWGGIASYDNPNGIDKFKMSFGGEYRKYYNISAVCSLRAKLYTLLRKVFRK